MNGYLPAAKRAKYQSPQQQQMTKTVTVYKQLGELKGVDTLLALTPIPSTTSTNDAIFVTNLIAPGNGSYNRVGRKVQLDSLRLKGLIQHAYQAAATTANVLSNVVRMVVVYDKQPSGALPVFSDIFGNTVQAGTESSLFLDSLRYDNTERFMILRDKVINFDAESTPPVGGSQNTVFETAYFDEYINVNKTTNYSGQSATQTIADISSGALYVIFRAQLNTTGASQCAVSNATARLRYRD